ncbi:MAG: hypothetical protein DME55_07765 [Verrucomicrobia bacterium]|nr:MAG: hypothetical protein DME55_07765 [Verrucomicrobiota bacterium]
MRKFRPDPLPKNASFIRRLEYWIQYIISFFIFDFDGLPALSGLLTGLALMPLMFAIAMLFYWVLVLFKHIFTMS